CDGYGEHRREHNDDRDDRPPSHIASLFVGSDMGVNVARHAGSPAPEQQRALSYQRSVRPAETPHSAAPSVSPLAPAPVRSAASVTLNSAAQRTQTGYA